MSRYGQPVCSDEPVNKYSKYRLTFSIANIILQIYRVKESFASISGIFFF